MGSYVIPSCLTQPVADVADRLDYLTVLFAVGARAAFKEAAATLRAMGRDDRGILELAGVDCDQRALVMPA